MASLADYIQRVHSKYPGTPSTIDPFSKRSFHAPTMLKGQTNRILVYKGSFSPPHVGHLALLKHAFEHGGRDLNMIAAIVKPLGGCARAAKAKCSEKIISFSMEERVALWKNDERLPEWVWVYQDSMVELRKMMYSLVEMAEEDGYRLEFVALYGPDNSGWLNEPHRCLRGEVTLVDGDEEKKDVKFGGCKIMLICDAARKAEDFDTGRLKTFTGCGSWTRPALETKVLIAVEKAKAEIVMTLLKEREQDEYQRLVDDAGSEAAAIGDIAKRFVTEALLDNQQIVVCHAKKDESITRRFVRLDRSAPGFQESVVSGTVLRNAIEAEEGESLWDKVEEMALSPGVLRKMMGIEKGGEVVDQGCHETCIGAAVWEEELEKT